MMSYSLSFSRLRCCGMQHNRFAYPGCGTASQGVFSHVREKIPTGLVGDASRHPLDPPLQIVRARKRTRHFDEVQETAAVVLEGRDKFRVETFLVIYSYNQLQTALRGRIDAYSEVRTVC